MTSLNNEPETQTPLDLKIVEFENFLKAKFPKIWVSVCERTLGDNELWLYDLCRMAFFSGWDASQNHVVNLDDHLNWDN